jgi:hypothetical protein
MSFLRHGLRMFVFVFGCLCTFQHAAADYEPAADTPGAVGRHWNRRISPSLNDWLRAVTHGGDRWVAVGDNGALFYSLDGEVWHDAAHTDGDNMAAVCWTGSRFVAVGRGGGGFISADGIVWSRISTGTGPNLNAMAWIGDKLVAVGDSGRITSSPDGENWTPAAVPPPSAFSGKCIASNGGRIVAGGNGVYYSDDGGSTWVPATTAPSSTVAALAWNGSTWLGAGEASGVWRLSSATAESWSEARICYNATPTALLVDGNRALIATTGIQTTTAEFGYQGELLLSEDSGATWWGMTQPFRYAPLAVSRHQGKWLGVGKQGIILTSDDGITWTNRLLSGLDAWTSKLGGSDPTVTRRSLPAPALLLSSLIHRHPSSLCQFGQPGTKPRGVDWNGSQFVAVGSDSVFVSSDGVQWLERTPNFFQFLPTDVCWTGSQWLIVATFGKVYTSSNAISWTQGTLPLTYPSQVISTGSRLVAIGTSGQIASSTNGSVWSFSDLGIRDLNDISWHDGRYIVVGDYGFAATSTDGISWTETPSATTTALATVEWSGGRFVSIGSTWGRPVLTTGNGSAWNVTRSEVGFGPSETLSLDGDLIAMKGPEISALSRDGLNWSTSSAAISPTFTTGAWNGRYFTVFSTDGRVFISPDGRSWSEQRRLPVPYAATDVIPDGDGFLFVGARDVFRSGDSFAWNHVYNPGDGAPYLSAVATSGSQWIAVGQSGAIVRSDNGSNWAPADSGTTWPLVDATWAGDRFVATGHGGTLLISPNGVAWQPVATGRTDLLKNPVWTGSTLFVVASERYLLSSSNFTTWSTTDLGANTRLTSLLWTGHRLVGISTDGPGSRWMEFADGAIEKSWPLGFWESNIGSLIWDGGQVLAIGPYIVMSSGDSRGGFEKWTANRHVGAGSFDEADPLTGQSAGLVYAFGSSASSASPRIHLIPQSSPQSALSIEFSTPVICPGDVGYFLERTADLSSASWDLVGAKAAGRSWQFMGQSWQSSVSNNMESFKVDLDPSSATRCFYRIRVSKD